MKSTDKKTLILLGILLAIAAIVIIVSQNFEEQKNRFGVTTESETNSTVITTVETTEKITEKETTTAPTTVVTTTEPTTESTTEPPTEPMTEPPTSEPPATAEQTTVDEKPVSETDVITTITTEPQTEPEREIEKPIVRRRIYTAYDTEFGLLNIKVGNTFDFTTKNSGARYEGVLSKVYSGDYILSETNLTKRKLKKIGFNPNEQDIRNLYFVEFRIESHSFTLDGKSVTSYFNPSVFRQGKDKVQLLIYYDNETGEFQTYDFNGDFEKMNNTTGFYF